MLRPRSGNIQAFAGSSSCADVVQLTTSRFIAESRQQVGGRYEGGIARGRWGGLDRRVRDRFQQLLGTRKRAARAELDLSLDQHLQQAKSTSPKAGPCRSRSCPACLTALFEWSSCSWVPSIHANDAAFEAEIEDEDPESARAMLRPVAHPGAPPPSVHRAPTVNSLSRLLTPDRAPPSCLRRLSKGEQPRQLASPVPNSAHPVNRSSAGADILDKHHIDPCAKLEIEHSHCRPVIHQRALLPLQHFSLPSELRNGPRVLLDRDWHLIWLVEASI